MNLRALVERTDPSRWRPGGAAETVLLVVALAVVLVAYLSLIAY